jgi:hypothetical protein
MLQFRKLVARIALMQITYTSAKSERRSVLQYVTAARSDLFNVVSDNKSAYRIFGTDWFVCLY